MNYAKHAYERALYLREEIDESVFKDGCKYKEKYSELMEKRDAKRVTEQSFTSVSEKVLADALGTEQPQDDHHKFNPQSFINAISPTANLAATLVQGIEDEFDFDIGDLHGDDLQRFKGLTKEIKAYVATHIVDMHISTSKELADRVASLRTSFEIMMFLGHKALSSRW